MCACVVVGVRKRHACQNARMQASMLQPKHTKMCSNVLLLICGARFVGSSFQQYIHLHPCVLTWSVSVYLAAPGFATQGPRDVKSATKGLIRRKK